MVQKYIILSIFILSLSLAIGCSSNPSSGETVEISIATLNDNIIKYAIDIRSGLIDTSTLKVIAGDSTRIKVPIDIEVNRENKLFVLNQGTNSIPPEVTIFSDTANGNTRPEAVINVNTGTDFKAVGLAIAENIDFIFVSYFPTNGSTTSKIIRFSISSGARLPFDVDSSSIGDIELPTSGNTIFAVDPFGRQILQFRINSNFEIQSGLLPIKGGRTGLQNPNSIAISTDGSIHVYDKYTRTEEGRLFVFAPNSSGDIAPSRIIWSYCPAGKTLFTPYGLAVTEQLEAKVMLTCSGNKVITFPANVDSCEDSLQRIDIPAPVAVAFDKVRFQ